MEPDCKAADMESRLAELEKRVGALESAASRKVSASDVSDVRSMGDLYEKIRRAHSPSCGTASDSGR